MAKKKKQLTQKQLIQQITEQIVEALKNNVIPWEKPWNNEGGLRCFPRSVSTGKLYNGINTWMLPLLGYNSPWWITAGQVAKRGGTIKDNQKPTVVVFWKVSKFEDKTTKKERVIPMLKYFEVYNLEQCDIPADELAKLDKRLDKLAGAKIVKTEDNKNERIEICEATIRAYLEGQSLSVQDSSQAFYRVQPDTLHMPTLDTFTTSEHYYATLFHEAVHSTGHPKRLARKIENKFGTKAYAREELTAELGASFLCGILGIDTQPVTENRDAYIKGWLKKLQDDEKCILVASGKAGHATDMILGTKQKGDKEYAPKKKAKK